MKTSRPYIIDIESSGLSSKSYPIEVGVVLDDGSKFCTLIKPAESWQFWDKKAEEVHHISRKVLMTHGKPVIEVAEELNKQLAGLTLYSDGWVVDKPWLTMLFYQAGIEMEFNVSPLELILNEQQMLHWHETKQQIIEQHHLQRHRASTDAWIIQETYASTLNLNESGSH